MTVHHCDTCDHYVKDQDADPCAIGHKPKWFAPRDEDWATSWDWGWKRDCTDFSCRPPSSRTNPTMTQTDEKKAREIAQHFALRDDIRIDEGYLAPTVLEAITAARAEGRRQGMDEAAKVVADYGKRAEGARYNRQACEAIAQACRSMGASIEAKAKEAQNG